MEQAAKITSRQIAVDSLPAGVMVAKVAPSAVATLGRRYRTPDSYNFKL